MSAWNSSSSQIFSRNFGHRVRETTVHLIKKAYLEGANKRAAKDGGDVTVLPSKKHGSQFFLARIWIGRSSCISRK